MAGIEDLVGQFGGLMAPQPRAEPSQWEQQLRDPATQAALLSFGLQALSGGWGNGAQQFAQAAGAGAQGGGVYNQQEQERTRYAQAREEQASSRAADRQTRLDVARIGADSRTEIANMRSRLSEERVNDRMAIAQMQQRRAAEANLQNARQRAVDGLMLVPASQRAARLAEIEAQFQRDMVRVARMYPVAGDPASTTPLEPEAAAPPAASGAPSAAQPPTRRPAAPTPAAAAPAPPDPSASGIWSNLPPGAGALRPPPGLNGLPPPARPPMATQPPAPAQPPPATTHPLSGAPLGQPTALTMNTINRLVEGAVRRDPNAMAQLTAIMRDQTNPELAAAAARAFNALRARMPQ